MFILSTHEEVFHMSYNKGDGGVATLPAEPRSGEDITYRLDQPGIRTTESSAASYRLGERIEEVITRVKLDTNEYRQPGRE